VPAILAALAAAVVMGRLRDQNRRLSTTQNDHMAEQARVEAELRQSQERSAAIVETMVNGIALLDMDGRITFANRMAESIMGLSREEISDRYSNGGSNLTSLDGEPVAHYGIDEPVPWS
jgi:PAS domain-containing protein